MSAAQRACVRFVLCVRCVMAALAYASPSMHYSARLPPKGELRWNGVERGSRVSSCNGAKVQHSLRDKMCFHSL